MFNAILSFELRQQFKKAFTWVFLMLMFAQGLYYMRHTGEFFGADKTYANAPAVLFIVIAGIGYIGFIVTAILGGSALAKDLDFKTASLLYTTRASERSLFWGRFTGSLTVLLVLNAAYLLGIIVYTYLPIPNMGPLSWFAIFKAVLMVFLPNIFVLYSLCFSVSVFTGSSKPAYGVVLFAMLLLIFAETSFNSNVNVVLADPTAFAALHAQLEHLSPAEKNNYSPGFSGLLFYNRLIWVAIATTLIGLARKKYSFQRFISKVQNAGKKQQVDNDRVSLSSTLHLNPLIKVTPHFSFIADLKKVFSLSWLEFKSVTRTIGFKLFLGLLLLIYVCYIAVWQQQYYSAAPTLPVTIEITGVTLPLSFYFLLFLIINTTELLFKNQSSGFWQIGDALPLPNWVTVLSKIMAMIGVSFLLTTCLMVFGVMVQGAKGYYNFEFGVYLNDLYIRWMPKYIVFILLTVFVAGITANRYATYWITILVLITGVVLHEIDVIEQNRLNFMFSPGGGMNTDMNGYGIFASAHSWFMLYWFCLSLVLLSLGLWLWQRGIVVPFGKRLLKSKFSLPLVLILITGAAGFLLIGSKIYQTVNIDNKFQTKDQERGEQALYEKAYKSIQTYPHPKIEKLELNLDLFPKERDLRYTAFIALKNSSSKLLDTLHIEWMDFSMIKNVVVAGYRLKLIKDDEELRHRIYSISPAVQAGSGINMQIEGRLKYSSFTNGDPQKELAFNGSFLSGNIVPHFGYDDRRELKENKYRLGYGLQKISSRLPLVTDTIAAAYAFASTQADSLNYTLNISTEAGQSIVAPGILNKKWVKKGRGYFQFVSPGTAAFNFHILSANYALHTETVKAGEKTITIEVYYHPAHAYNVKSIVQSAKEALGFLSGTLGQYPYATLRIAERPRYDQELFAYGNVIVLPENHGWIADISRREDLDYLRYVTAKLIAQQYMQQGDFSRTAGYPLLTHSIPGYLAYLQLKAFYGTEALKKHLEKNNDLYLKGRAKEPNTEPAVLNADEQADYVYDFKGPQLLYQWSALIGEKRLNNIIASFLKDSQTKRTNAWKFYEKLERAVAIQDKAKLKKDFENTAD